MTLWSRCNLQGWQATKTTITRFLNSLNKLEDYVKYYRSQVSLPRYLHEVMIGLLLSDGSLERTSKTSSARLSVVFGLKHAPYLLFLFNLFETYINGGPDVASVYNKKTKSSNVVIKFKTQSLPLLVYYYNMFYKLDSKGKYVKCIPVNIYQLLTPVVLAHLIMGDGNIKLPDQIIRIYTNSFIKEDIERLALAISNKLKIRTRAVHDRNGQYMLTISKDQLPLVRKLLTSHMHPSMYYKLGLEQSNSDFFNYSYIKEDI